MLGAKEDQLTGKKQPRHECVLLFETFGRTIDCKGENVDQMFQIYVRKKNQSFKAVAASLLPLDSKADSFFQK